MELLYLTAANLKDFKKLRELLRFKEMLAMLYTKDILSIGENSKLLKALVLLDKDSFQLLKYKWHYCCCIVNNQIIKH